MPRETSTPGSSGFGWNCSDVLTARDAENLRRFNVVALAWAMLAACSSIAIGEFGVKGLTGWALAVATLLLGLTSIWLYLKFLRNADELLRKIHVDALGLGFGAAIVFMLFWRLCERLGAPKLDVSDPVLIMVLFWAAGQWIGLRRFRAESPE